MNFTQLSIVPDRSNRRELLSGLGRGCAGVALASLLHSDAKASGNAVQGAPGPHFPPRAKSVIWLFMNGGVSHLESFDPKPEVTNHACKTISETPFADVQNPKRLEGVRVALKQDSDRQQNKLFPLQVGFKKRGQSGIEVSDWFPHIGERIDDIAVVRSMFTTDNDHMAQTQFHSGRNVLDGEFPTLGAWVHYGLGSLNDNLPQFISMGTREYWNRRDGHYLGPEHDAVPLRTGTTPLDFSTPEFSRTPREAEVASQLIAQLHRAETARQPNDQALAARIKAYELAFRMQQSIPAVMDFSSETAATQSLYGLDAPETVEFGSQLLAARRLVEQGVRFIQIQHGGGAAGAWDAHSGLQSNHERLSKAVDRPIAGLLADLKQRGLLEETIVLFATEFGRTPGSEGADGRDHHPFAFSIWMAGAGIKGGTVHGATDELGFHAVEDRHYVTDVHATILKLLGLDSREMEIPGRKRLEIDHGHPIEAILS